MAVTAPPPPPLGSGGTWNRKSFADILQPQGNKTPHLLIKPLDNFKGEPCLTVEADEHLTLEAPWRLACVGKFQRRCPPLDLFKKDLERVGFKGGFCVGWLNNNHVVVRFNQEEDYCRFWRRGQWRFCNLWMRVFKWTFDFNVYEEPSIVPAWISFWGLPLHLFHKSKLFTLASAVGTPLALDDPTANLTRPNVARVCVELDLLKELPNRIWIHHAKTGKGFWQPITYDDLPEYCTGCMSLGHPMSDCRKGTKPPETKLVRQPAKAKATVDKGKRVSVFERIKPAIDDASGFGANLVAPVSTVAEAVSLQSKVALLQTEVAPPLDAQATEALVTVEYSLTAEQEPEPAIDHTEKDCPNSVVDQTEKDSRFELGEIVDEVIVEATAKSPVLTEPELQVTRQGNQLQVSQEMAAETVLVAQVISSPEHVLKTPVISSPEPVLKAPVVSSPETAVRSTDQTREVGSPDSPPIKQVTVTAPVAVKLIAPISAGHDGPSQAGKICVGFSAEAPGGLISEAPVRSVHSLSAQKNPNILDAQFADRHDLFASFRDLNKRLKESTTRGHLQKSETLPPENIEISDLPLDTLPDHQLDEDYADFIHVRTRKGKRGNKTLTEHHMQTRFKPFKRP